VFSAASRKSKFTRVRLVVSCSYIATCQALEFEMGSTRLLLRSETRLLVSFQMLAGFVAYVVKRLISFASVWSRVIVIMRLFPAGALPLVRW